MSLWFGSGSEVQTLRDDSNSREKFQSPISKTFAWTLKFFVLKKPKRDTVFHNAITFSGSIATLEMD